MDNLVRHRFWKGFGANIYGQAVTIVIQIAGVPFLLHAWGPELYGEWLMLFAIPAYLSMTDLGFSQSAANDMTSLTAAGDRTQALKVFQTLIALVLSSMAIMMIGVTLIVFLLPLDHWLRPARMSVSEVRWTLWFLAMAVLTQLFDGITHAGFRANGQYAFHRSLHATTRLVQFTGLWGSAFLGGGPVYSAAVFCIIRSVATVLFAFALTARHRWLRYGVHHASLSELRRLFRPALGNLTFPLAQGANIQGMVLAVGGCLGPVAVVTFSTLRTMSRLALQLCGSITNAVEPELAAACGRGYGALGRTVFLEALRGVLWFSLAVAAGLGVLGERILGFWTQGKVAMDFWLFAFLLSSSAIGALWYQSFVALKAVNKHLKTSCVYAVSSLAVVLLAVGLLSASGKPAAAGAAVLTLDVIMLCYAFPAACGLMRLGPMECVGALVKWGPISQS
jgi:O-antigen/teichoic acid export membrane protein